MRYSCSARGEQCLVEVELTNDRVRVMIYSAGTAKELRHPYNASIDTSRACPDPDVFAEQVAREALAEYEAGGDPDEPSFEPPDEFAGVLTRLP